jgi:hypothetical protein
VAEDVTIAIEEHFTTITKNFAILHVSTNFAPQLLRAEQEDKCLNTCKHTFQQAEVKENFKQVIIMDDMWVYKNDIKIKQQTSQWKSKSSQNQKHTHTHTHNTAD